MFWFLFVTSFLWSRVAGLTVWEGGGEEVCRPLSHCKQSKIDSLPIESLHCGVEYFVQNRYPIFFKFSSRENLAKANWSFAAVLNHIQAQTCTALISPTDKSGSHWKSILASSFLKWEPLPAWWWQGQCCFETLVMVNMAMVSVAMVKMAFSGKRGQKSFSKTV